MCDLIIYFQSTFLNTIFVTEIKYIGSVLISGVYTCKGKIMKTCEL